MITYDDVREIRKRMVKEKECVKNGNSTKDAMLMIFGMDVALKTMRNAVNEFIYWVYFHGKDDKSEKEHWKCSHCGYVTYDLPTAQYCPGCGGEMDRIIDEKLIID